MKIKYIDCVSSTNTLLKQADSEVDVLIAGHQQSGKGRNGRSWYSQERESLLMSVRVSEPQEKTKLGLVPLAAGLAVAEFVSEQLGITEQLGATATVELKWPNDVLISGRKVAGVLAQATETNIIIGVGINLTSRMPEELYATSLTTEGWQNHALNEKLVADELTNLAQKLAERIRVCVAEIDAVPENFLSRYREQCMTIGREVTVDMPAQKTIEGIAEDIHESGQLLVNTGVETLLISAGDAHLSNAPQAEHYSAHTKCKECI